MVSSIHARTRSIAPLVIAAVVAVIGSLAFAGAASAAKIGSGEAKLTVKKSIVKKLKKADVKIKAQSPATKAGKVLTFPITGGDLSTGPYHPAGTASGNVTLGGGIKFKGDKKKKLKIKALNAVFAAESRLEGSKGDVLNLVKLGTVSGDGLTITGAKGKTAKDLKKKIKKKFDVNLKKKTFGFFDVAAVKDPQTTINAGGEIALTFSGKALTELGPQGPAAIPPATLNLATATLRTPITGGIFNTSTLFGEVESAGGVELTGCQGPSGANVTFENPTVLLDATPTLNVFSSITGGRVDIATVTLPTPPAVSGNAVTITDANAAINSTATQALNALCGTAFVAGDSLGLADASFTIAG